MSSDLEWVLSELGKEATNASRPFSFKEQLNFVFVNTGDVLAGRMLHSSISSCEGLPGQAKKALRRDDILLTEIRPGNGRFAYVDFDPKQHVVSTKFMVIESLGRVVPRFLYHVLTNQLALNEFQRIAESRSGTFPQITFDSIAHFPVPIPPVAEQARLAHFFDEIQQRVELFRETNTTLEAIAQALFKSWFVDFDPVRAKQQSLAPAGMDDATAALFPDIFEELASGLVPKGWECIDLAELTKRFEGSIQTGPFGSQLHASDYVESGVPVVMPKDIVNRRASTESVARIGAADADRLSRHKLQAGDIVFSRRGDVERHALITEREVGWLCGTGCLLLRPGRQWHSPGFLSMLLDAPRARTWLVQHAVGATMPNLNTGILGSVPVVLPSPSILSAFEELVSVTEEQRSRNASMAETLATLRDTLLPRLISGQLRLPEVEAFA
jgi:type I restriction enzyme, S subunit